MNSKGNALKHMTSNPLFKSPSTPYHELQTPLTNNPLFPQNSDPISTLNPPNESDNENEPLSRFYTNSKKRLNAEAKAKAEANAKAKEKTNYNSEFTRQWNKIIPIEPTVSFPISANVPLQSITYSQIMTNPEYKKYEIMLQAGVPRPQMEKVMEEEGIDPIAMKIIAEQAVPPLLPMGPRSKVGDTLSNMMGKFAQAKATPNENNSNNEGDPRLKNRIALYKKKIGKGGKRSTRKTHHKRTKRSKRKTHRKH
jgi:hypothetical protein